MKIILTLIIAFIISCSFCVTAQIDQPKRYEIEVKQSDENFSIISLEEEGLALFRETNKYEKGNRSWELIILDTTLQEKYNEKHDIDARNDFIGYDYVDGTLSLLFRKGETEKSDLTLLVFDLSSKIAKTYVIKPEIAIRLTHFNQAGKSFVLSGYVGSEPAIVLFNPTDESIQIIPGFFQKDFELIDVRSNQNQTFNVVLIDRSNRSDRKLTFRTFDTSGTLLLEDVVRIDDDIMLQTGMVSTLKREDILLLGTWGTKNSKQSTGFYALPINPFAEQKIEYLAFAELEHFFDYLKPKRAKRIIERSKEDLKTGRTPKYSNYVIPHRIIEHAKGFILLADVYNPTSSMNNQYYSPYNNPYNNYYYDPLWGYNSPRRIYNNQNAYGNNFRNNDDAIKTYETVIASFDQQGKLKWDESMKLDDIKLSTPEQVTDFSLTGEKIYFIYKKESELNIKMISLVTNEVEELTEKIKLTNDTDEIRSEDKYDGAIRQWFENTFYVWGYQSIKNKADRENQNRQVFYINKVLTQ